MAGRELVVEHLARRFHYYHDVFTPYFASAAAEPRGESWEDVPEDERRRLVAAIRLVLADAVLSGEPPADRDDYFAKPGEAEWGC